jgi:nitrate/nitrite-specific signal transduction histidine kinase
MKSALRNHNISPSRLTRLYIIALSSIAIFAIIGQILVQISLAQQSDDARVINFSGRQRMLSLKLTMAVSTLVIPSDPLRDSRMSEVRDTLTKLENERHGLMNGDSSLGLPGGNSATVTQLLNSIQPDFDAITAAARDILNKNGAIPSAQLQQDVDTILAHEENFVKVMNDTTAQYQHEAEGRVTNLKVEELILLILTLAVLLLEGTFIFRPAIRNLQTSITQLVKAEKQVAAHTTELESKNSELELAFQEAMAAHRKVMPHARVVSYGHYQVQASNGSYYTVKTHNVNGNYHLECECLMYRRNLICSHSLAAASMHSALLRNHNQRHLNDTRNLLHTPDYRGGISGEVSG